MKQMLSALIDGELEIKAINRLMREMERNELVETAALYFRIGDVLRNMPEPLEMSSQFASKLSKILEMENYLLVGISDEVASISQSKGKMIVDV